MITVERRALMTIAEAALFLGVPESTARREALSARTMCGGKIPVELVSLKTSRARYRVRRVDVERYAGLNEVAA